MEKNQTSSPKAVCEKIFRAITFGPAFSKIRGIYSRPQTPSPGSEVPIKFDYTPSSTQIINGEVPLAWTGQQGKTPKSSADAVVQSGKPTPRFASRIEPETPVLTGQSNKSKAKAEKGNGQIQVPIDRNQPNKEEAGKKPTDYDRFTAFIDSTRKKIMSPHDQEQGENPPKGVGHNHGHGFGKDHHYRRE